jgi:sortase (surface protein transpeptidase)
MKSKTQKRKNSIWGALLALIGLGLIIVGSYSLYASLTRPKANLAVQPPQANIQANTPQKTPDQKKAYVVPPFHPRELIIKKLGVNANILPMGTTKGVLNAPATAWDVGWYNQSALPGTGQGALLIDGHVNNALNTPGVFYGIDTLTQGDEIDVERGDGKVFSYYVTTVEQVPTSRVDMSAALTSAVPDQEGLNLITCGGTYNYKQKTYNDRVIVFAAQRS